MNDLEALLLDALKGEKNLGPLADLAEEQGRLDAAKFIKLMLMGKRHFNLKDRITWLKVYFQDVCLCGPFEKLPSGFMGFRLNPLCPKHSQD